MHPRSPSTSTFAFTSTCKALAVAAVMALALSLAGPALGAVAVEVIVLDNARYLRWSAEDSTSFTRFYCKIMTANYCLDKYETIGYTRRKL